MKSKKHLKFVRSLSCINCEAPQPSEAHHAIDLDHLSGMGMKASDLFSIPLCGSCHWDIHNSSGNTKIWLHSKQWEWIAKTLVKRLEIIDSKT